MDPFDPTLAAGATLRLPTARVVDLLPLTHAPERISEYREAMRRGDRFPPVAVIRFAGRYLVADGHKRLTAYAGLGRPEIVVEVWTFSRFARDQFAQAAANARKNARILSRAVSDPRGAWRLVLTTILHWRRVARSLAARLTGAR